MPYGSRSIVYGYALKIPSPDTLLCQIHLVHYIIFILILSSYLCLTYKMSIPHENVVWNIVPLISSTCRKTCLSYLPFYMECRNDDNLNFVNLSSLLRLSLSKVQTFFSASCSQIGLHSIHVVQLVERLNTCLYGTGYAITDITLMEVRKYFCFFIYPQNK
jgi:hypothetical protein